MPSPARKVWEYKEGISWGIPVAGGTLALVHRASSGSSDLLGVLATIGAFGLGFWGGVAFGYVIVGGLVLAHDRLLRRNSKAAAILVVLVVCGLATGFAYVAWSGPWIHHHSKFLIFCGVGTLVVPLLFVWHRFLSEPAGPEVSRETRMERNLLARSQAGAVRDQAIRLGYDVVAERTGSEITFVVWRFDQPKDAGRRLTTIDGVLKYLEYVATLPQYCLDLAGNPRVGVASDTDGQATWITDNATGQQFAVRTEDLENVRTLYVHADAETPPTIGNWRAASAE